MNFGKKRRSTMTPILTPLIDVVFLLLVFFLLTSSFASPDLFRVVPPAAEIQDGEAPREVTLLVAQDGTLAVNNRPASQHDIEFLLLDEIRRTATSSVTIKADASTASGVIIGILRLVQNAGAGEVRLVTIRARDGTNPDQ